MLTQRQQAIKAAFERALNGQQTQEDMDLLAEAARASEIADAIQGPEGEIRKARIAAMTQRMERDRLER
jgi:hypothetical protein